MLLITVLNVEKTEFLQVNAHVHSIKVIMKLLTKLIAHHVLQFVKPVLSIIHVLPVKLTLIDIWLQNVHVKMDIMLLVMNVYLVNGHVLNVKTKPPNVSQIVSKVLNTLIEPVFAQILSI
jgi:hypothetical protein